MTPVDAGKRLVIVGATGMVGGYAVRYALDRAAVGGVTTIGRKPTGITHPKLNEVLHQDFADCSRLADAPSRQDAGIFCLGAYCQQRPHGIERTSQESRGMERHRSRALFDTAAADREVRSSISRLR
jgi:putative NADH-flavin reductase